MWRVWKFSHLQKWSLWDLKVWSQISRWMNLWKIWNTWNVHPKPGKWDLQTWSHVDITVSEWWKFIPAEQAEALINAWKVNARPLWKTKFAEYQKIRDDFAWNAQIKSFEKASIEWLNLLDSLSSNTWPWDVAAIFQFMKSLDPTSTVRWEEFDTAARSLWLLEEWKNLLKRVTEWRILSAIQSKIFWQIAIWFLKNRADQYESKWGKTFSLMKIQWIPWTFMPNNEAQRLKVKLIEQVWTNLPTNNSWKSNQEILEEAWRDASNEDFFSTPSIPSKQTITS